MDKTPEKAIIKALPNATEFCNTRSQRYLSMEFVDQSINLEKVLLIEDKLWSLLELHRFLELNKPSATLIAQKMSEAAVLVDEWWELTH